MEATTLREIALRVSQYFRDFLESDFKRQQSPRRRVVLQSDSGFRAGMRVGSYPELQKEIWKLLSKPTSSDLSLAMQPRRYTRPISPTLKRVIEEQVAVIPESSVFAVRQGLIDRATATFAKAVTNPEKWVDALRADLASDIGELLVRPLIAHLDGPLTQQSYSVMDTLYAAESDLVARVADGLDRVLPEVLARYLATQDPGPVRQASTEFLTLESVRAALLSFFEGFVAADAFQEFRDLETYVATSDGLQLYLYVGSLKFANATYPLFFLPVEVQRSPEGVGYVLKLLPSPLFANRPAIDFVLQELATAQERSWVAPIRERITYLTPEQSLFEVARGLFRLVANAVDLPGKIELSTNSPDASTARVTMSSALYLAAYERSDESLINDYEEIINQAKTGGSAIVDLFHKLVGGILTDNPVSIGASVAAAWEEMPLVDRVVFDSPIPLNEEQRKILLATKNPQGRIIVVEGPPGTGKSHTIVAVAADCAFNQRSCLVLSDKTEALDVVQSKLSEAMSRVRHERDFPNPILRLGQQNANFKRLTSNQAVSQISAYARAMKAGDPVLQAERQDTKDHLKQAIEGTVATLGSLALVDLQAMHHDEMTLGSLSPAVMACVQRHADTSFLPQLDALAGDLEALEVYLAGLFETADFTPESLWTRVRRDACLYEFSEGRDTSAFSKFERLDASQVLHLSGLLVSFEQLRMPVIGYLFRGGAVRVLDQQLNALPATSPAFLKQHGALLSALVESANVLRTSLETAGVGPTFSEAYAVLAQRRVASGAACAALKALTLLRRLDPEIVAALLQESKDDARLWTLSIQFLRRWLSTRKVFDQAPKYDYVGSKTHLERLNTSVMNAHVDRRLVDFMDNHRADAKALAAVISRRQKFPEEKFENIRTSFPVIIASIREFGEFMPLAPDLFDVVIIDEASQVSVAQALPALLRAKTIVVLGDSKQFSNVKSSNASNELNDKYRADLVQYFEQNVTRQAAALQRLAMFDVKRSILEFCSMAASYSVTLRKHFRSYPELIGYSSSTFYNHQLQAIKIRSVPLNEVICFDQVAVGDRATSRTSNAAEADFVLERLLELVDETRPPTVGVITPFREQQTLLTKLLFNHTRGRDFEDKLRLKIMTFDSCQGEERSIIFYSLVATPGNDALNYIFPVSLTDPAQSVEEKLKVQRLNVGFSRAQEMIWFVHSMPISTYKGAIGQALNHYLNVLRSKDVRADQTDPASPMEAKLLGWLQNTEFVQMHPEEVEILPQFPVGEYLRQLDPTYVHPDWRVDFLLTFQSTKGPVHVVIEYDGFEHHFQKGKQVHIGNHQRYLVEADIERQLTLESYGYRFLRVNRFNLGKDPVTTLSDRLTALIEVAAGEPTSKAVNQVLEQAAGLASKELKACSRCGKIQRLDAFFDPGLKSGEGGHGRVCMPCKDKESAETAARPLVRRRRRWR